MYNKFCVEMFTFSFLHPYSSLLVLWLLASTPWSYSRCYEYEWDVTYTLFIDFYATYYLNERACVNLYFSKLLFTRVQVHNVETIKAGVRTLLTISAFSTQSPSGSNSCALPSIMQGDWYFYYFFFHVTKLIRSVGLCTK